MNVYTRLASDLDLGTPYFRKLKVDLGNENMISFGKHQTRVDYHILFLSDSGDLQSGQISCMYLELLRFNLLLF